MTVVILAVSGAGATAEYSFGDWVLALAPALVSLFTLVIAAFNFASIVWKKENKLERALTDTLHSHNNNLIPMLVQRFDYLTWRFDGLNGQLQGLVAAIHRNRP